MINMRSAFVFVGLALVALAQDSQELFNQAIQAYRGKRYADAVQLLERVLTSNPSDAFALTAHLYLATAWMQQYIPGAESPDNMAFARRAEAEFQEVLRREPADRVALASLASLKYREAQGVADFDEKSRKLDEAASWYVRLIGVDTNNKEAYYSLGVIDWVKWYHADMEARTSMGMKPEQPGPLLITAVRRDLAERYSGVIEDGIANLSKARNRSAICRRDGLYESADSRARGSARYAGRVSAGCRAGRPVGSEDAGCEKDTGSVAPARSDATADSRWR